MSSQRCGGLLCADGCVKTGCLPLQTNQHQATLLLSRAQGNRYKTLRTIICANLSVWDALWRHRIVVRRGGLRGPLPGPDASQPPSPRLHFHTSISTSPPPRPTPPLHLHDHYNLESTRNSDAHIPAHRDAKAQRPATRDTDGGAAHDHKHGGACEATGKPSCGTSKLLRDPSTSSGRSIAAIRQPRSDTADASAL
jgi:hypothetical protein